MVTYSIHGVLSWMKTRLLEGYIDLHRETATKLDKIIVKFKRVVGFIVAALCLYTDSIIFQKKYVATCLKGFRIIMSTENISDLEYHEPEML